MMSVLLAHLGSMLPWAWARAGVRTGERALLRSLFDELPKNTLLVADAGFTGFELLSELRERGTRRTRTRMLERSLADCPAARRARTQGAAPRFACRWPHKQQQTPAGQPRITTATDTQRTAASQLQ